MTKLFSVNYSLFTLHFSILCSLFTIHRPRLLVRRTLLAVLCSLFTVHLLVKPALAAVECNLTQCQIGKQGIAQDRAVRGCDGLTPPGKYQCSNGSWVKVNDSLPESGGAAYSSQYASWYAKPVKQIEACVFGDPDNEVSQCKFIFDINNKSLTSLGILMAGNSRQVPPEKRMRGAIQSVGSTIAFMVSRPPAQTAEYIAYISRNAGFQVYAADERGGFDILKPVQQIWIATRNIAYLITSLTLVVIGFMIMLRKKIDAQTVIGVQQALPKLVVTLLLITFSYAIVGFMIDIMYFLIYAGVNTLSFFGVLDNPSKALEQITQHSAFGIGIRGIFVTGTTDTAADAIGNFFNAMIGTETWLGEVAGSLFSQSIAFVLVAGAILYAVFKLFFALLMAYIQIIFSVIIGPLQIMLNALPGSEAFSKWFRNLLANVLAFPAAAIMLIFGAALMGLTTWGVRPNFGFQDQSAQTKWLPPLLNLDADAASSGNVNSVDAIQAIIGIGIIFMTYKVVDMVKEWVQAPEFKYGSAIGEAVGFGYQQAKGAAMWGPSTAYGIRAGEEQEREHLAMDMRARGATQAQINAKLAALRPIQRGARWQRLGSQIMGSVFKK